MAVDWAKAEIVLAHLETGKSLFASAKEAGTSHPSFLRWVGESPELADRYARAREMCLEAHADAIIEIADECEDPAKGRLQVDARKWILAKLRPHVYGENINHNVKGGLTVTLSNVDNEV